MKRLFRVIATAMLGAGQLHAMRTAPVSPEPIAVSRLVERAEMYVRDYPKDPAGLQTLALIHALAFKHQAFYLDSKWSTQFRRDKPPFVKDSAPTFGVLDAESMIRALKRKGLKTMPPLSDPTMAKEYQVEKQALQEAGWKPPVMTPEQSLKHFLAARDCFEKAIKMPAVRMPSHEARCVLGLADLWRDFALPQRHDALKELPGLLAPLSADELAGRFHRAFGLSKDSDLRRKFFHGGDREMEGLVSYSAGRSYLGVAPEGTHAAEVRDHLERLKAVPRN